MEFERFMNLFEENPKVIQRKQRAMSRKLLCCDSLRTFAQGARLNKRPRNGKPKRKWEVFFDWGQKEKHSKKRHEERNKSDPKYNLWFFYFNIFFNIQEKTKKCFPQIRLITFHFSEVQRFQSFSFTWDWDLFKESKVHETWWGLGSVQTFLDADFLECCCERVWFCGPQNKETYSFKGWFYKHV